MWGLIREIAFYVIFLYTLMMVAYGERDFLTYPMIRNARSIFVDGTRDGLLEKTNFLSIQQPSDFFNWADQLLVPGLFPAQDYSGKPLPSDYKYAIDIHGFLAGTVRLRQLRVKKETCKVSSRLESVINHCRADYSVAHEDWEAYKKHWIHLGANDTIDDADEFFTWKGMNTLGGKPFVGLITTYWGGGYVADLGNDGEFASNVLNELRESNWLDAYTRAVFVEFSLFYPAVNMMVISNLLVEFISAGSTVVFPEIVSFSVDPYSSATGVPVMIAQVCCLLFLIYFIYREIRKLMKEKWKYFLGFWNWLEMLVIALFITALVMFVYASNLRQNLLNDYKSNPDKHVKFSSIVFWDEVYSWMLYIALFVANVKFLRLLRFNRRISMMVDTLTYGWRYMFAFFCTFLLVFMAFVSCSFMLFGINEMSFMSFLDTLESLLVVMLNKFDWSDFNQMFGPLFFIFYTILMNFILVNMFLSIVNDSFAVVKADCQDKANDFELMQFVWKKVLNFFGFSKAQVDATDGRPIYAEEQDIIERDLNDCNDKIEEMLIRMQDYFSEDHLEEKMKMDWRYKDCNKQIGNKRRVVASD